MNENNCKEQKRPHKTEVKIGGARPPGAIEAGEAIWEEGCQRIVDMYRTFARPDGGWTVAVYMEGAGPHLRPGASFRFGVTYRVHGSRTTERFEMEARVCARIVERELVQECESISRKLAREGLSVRLTTRVREAVDKAS